MGLYDGPAKGSRRPERGQKTRRNLSLESRFCGDSDVRRRICPLGLIGAEKIEIPFDRNASARNQFEVFQAGITHFGAGAIFTVLNDRIVQGQLVLCMRDDIVGAKSGEIKLANELANPNRRLVDRLAPVLEKHPASAICR